MIYIYNTIEYIFYKLSQDENIVYIRIYNKYK